MRDLADRLAADGIQLRGRMGWRPCTADFPVAKDETMNNRFKAEWIGIGVALLLGAAVLFWMLAQ